MDQGKRKGPPKEATRLSAGRSNGGGGVCNSNNSGGVASGSGIIRTASCAPSSSTTTSLAQQHPSPFKQLLNMKKSHIYNLEHRKKPDELRRKDLISAMKLPDHDVLNRRDYLKILDPWKQDWERGVQVPVDANTIPRTNVRPFNQDSPSNKRTVSCDVSIRHNKLKESFELPCERIEFHNSSDDFISRYELDLQDMSWLSAVRDSQVALSISDSLMEDVINELEQQCARNIKEKQIGIEYYDDTVCDVCQSPEAEDGNEIVFCEHCNIGVHQACYGIETIPDGDWLCNLCRNLDPTTKKKPACVLCPKTGGALKPTTRKSNQWAHVSCAYWIPEVKFVDYTLLEPIEIKSIYSWRWNLTCSLCNIKKGAPILCDEKNCRVAYHVTCAFKHRLKMKLVTQEDNNVRFKSYCLKHSDENFEEKMLKGEHATDFFSSSPGKSSNKNKQGNPNCEFWKHVDLKKLTDVITNQYADSHDLLVRGGDESVLADEATLRRVVDLIYQYWKLKRISNYGNSLIKLTLAQKFEEHMNSTLQRLISFRFHVERLRTAAYMIYKRDKEKERCHKAQKECFENLCKAFLKKEGNDLKDKETDEEVSEWNEDIYSEDRKLSHQILWHHKVYDDTPFDKTKDKNVTNYLMRQLKKLSEIERIQQSTSRGNPYARSYRNSLGVQRSETKNGETPSSQQRPASSSKRTRHNEDDDSRTAPLDEQPSKKKKFKRNLTQEFDHIQTTTIDETSNRSNYNFRHSPNQDEQHSNDSDSHQKENAEQQKQQQHQLQQQQQQQSQRAEEVPPSKRKLVKHPEAIVNKSAAVAQADALLNGNSFQRLRGGFRILRDRVSMAFKRSNA